MNFRKKNAVIKPRLRKCILHLINIYKESHKISLPATLRVSLLRNLYSPIFSNMQKIIKISMKR